MTFSSLESLIFEHELKLKDLGEESSRALTTRTKGKKPYVPRRNTSSKHNIQKEGLGNSKGKYEPKCFHYGKIGHIKKDCGEL